MRFVYFPDDFLRDNFLRFIVIKNSGTILRPGVVTLPVQRGGIMNREEDFQYFPKRNHVREKRDINCFSVTGFNRCKLLRK